MRWRVLYVVGTLYAVQFIPAIFIFMSLPIIMREAGHTATAIGLVQLVGIPYVFKFLWAPLIDRFKPGRDRYKSWILVLSLIHVAALLVLAFLDPAGPILPLFIILLIAITAVSTQDVAVDALAITLMHPEERAVGASFQSFGTYLAAILGAFGFLSVYNIFGWTTALLAQVVLFTAPLFALSLIDEPERPRDVPAVSLRSALSFFTRPRMGRWLALLATIRLPLIFISLPIRLMMVDVGMSTEEVALWFGLIAMSAAATAALVFGPMMRKLPRVLALYLVGFANLAVLVLVYCLAAGLPDSIRFAIVLVWIAVATTDTLLLRSAMDKVRPESPGFDFSVQVALFTLLGMLASPVSGVIIDAQGYLPVFGLVILLACIPLGILRVYFAPPGKAAVNLDGELVVSRGKLRSANTAAIFESCQQHFTEHGINCSRPGDNVLMMESMGCKVEMKAQDDVINIHIETPTDNFMIFIRDEIVEHIGDIDPQAMEGMSWSGGIQVGALPSNFLTLRAIKRREIFPGLMRVTLAGTDVKALGSDGIHIKLMMPAVRGRRPVWPVISENGGIAWPTGDDKLHSRFVTIRHIRPAAQEIDVDIALHGGGLISDWASLDGDEQLVGIMGPGGDTQLPGTDGVLLAADLTGLPALARLIEVAQGQVSGHLFAAAPSQADLEAYLPAANLNVTAIRPEAFADELLPSVEQLAGDGVAYAWFAGEYTIARSLRVVLKEQLGLHNKSQHSMAYWREGKPGHHP